MAQKLPEGADLRLERDTNKQEIPERKLVQWSALDRPLFPGSAGIVQNIDGQKRQT